MGSQKAASSAEDAANNKQGGQTLGGLINESRDLAAGVLGATKESVALTDSSTIPRLLT